MILCLNYFNFSLFGEMEFSCLIFKSFKLITHFRFVCFFGVCHLYGSECTIHVFVFFPSPTSENRQSSGFLVYLGLFNHSLLLYLMFASITFQLQSVTMKIFFVYKFRYAANDSNEIDNTFFLKLGIVFELFLFCLKSIEQFLGKQ